jgi:hypothetical protein
VHHQGWPVLGGPARLCVQWKLLGFSVRSHTQMHTHIHSSTYCSLHTS